MDDVAARLPHPITGLMPDPADTVVASAGLRPDAALTNIVRIVVDTGAVLRAVLTHRTALLLRRADAL